MSGAMRAQDIASRNEVSDVIHDLCCEYKANIISRQAFIEQVAEYYNWFDACHMADCIDDGGMSDG